MDRYKALLNKLLFPPLWLIALLTVISTAGLVTVFVNGWDTSPVAYVVYMLSFYALTVLCIVCVKVFPEWHRNIKQKINDTRIGNRYMTDAVFRTHISLYRSLTINLLYVAANLISGIIYKSAWFSILAGYHAILAIMRFLLLGYISRNAIGESRIAELRRSRLCAIILTTVNIALSGAVLMMMYQDKSYEYHGMLIYVMAAYTFYITTSAVINIIKYWKYNSPIMLTAKAISLAAALVSMLSLETAMLSRFGADTSPEFRRIMIAATGAGVSVIVLAMSVYIIVKSSVEIKNAKQRK